MIKVLQQFDKIKTNAELKAKVIRASLILVASIVGIVGIYLSTSNEGEKEIVKDAPPTRLDLIPGDTTSIGTKKDVYRKMDWNDLKEEDELSLLTDENFIIPPPGDETKVVNTVLTSSESSSVNIDAAVEQRRRARMQQNTTPPAHNNRRNYNPYGNRNDWENRYADEDEELENYETQRDRQRKAANEETNLAQNQKKSNDPYNFDNLSDAEKRRVILTTGQAQYEESREISAMIMSSGAIRSGQTITLITKEPAILSLEKIPVGTTISGIVSFGENRLQVRFSTMRLKKKIVKVDLTLYGLDGIEGLPVSSDVFAREVEDTGVNEAISQGSSEAGVIGRVVGGLVHF